MSSDQKLAKEYLDALKHQRRLSAATLDNYQRAIDLLLGMQKENSVKHLEAAQVRRHVAMLHGKGLAPRTLALMHGPSFAGDGRAALLALAAEYDRRTLGRRLALDAAKAA